MTRLSDTSDCVTTRDVRSNATACRIQPAIWKISPASQTGSCRISIRNRGSFSPALVLIVPFCWSTIPNAKATAARTASDSPMAHRFIGSLRDRQPCALLILPCLTTSLALRLFLFRLRVRLADKLLPTAPAERPRHQDDREQQVPGRGDELLGDGVSGCVLGGRDALQRGDVERLGDACSAGCRRRHVRDRVAGYHAHERVEADRDAVRRQEDCDHSEAGDPRDRLGKEDSPEVRARVRENLTAFLRLPPPLR